MNCWLELFQKYSATYQNSALTTSAPAVHEELSIRWIQINPLHYIQVKMSFWVVTRIFPKRFQKYISKRYLPYVATDRYQEQKINDITIEVTVLI